MTESTYLIARIEYVEAEIARRRHPEYLNDKKRTPAQLEVDKKLNEKIIKRLENEAEFLKEER